MPKKNKKIGDSKIIIYNSKDGEAKLEVRLENETVWLSQKQMAELFNCSADNVGLHLKNIFNQGELAENSVTEEYSVTAYDGKNYKVKGYNFTSIFMKINEVTSTDLKVVKELEKLGWKSGNCNL